MVVEIFWDTASLRLGRVWIHWIITSQQQKSSTSHMEPRAILETSGFSGGTEASLHTVNPHSG